MLLSFKKGDRRLGRDRRKISHPREQKADGDIIKDTAFREECAGGFAERESDGDLLPPPIDCLCLSFCGRVSEEEFRNKFGLTKRAPPFLG